MIDVLLQDSVTLARFVHVLGAVTAVGAVLVTDTVNAVPHFRPAFAATAAKVASLLSFLVWSGFALLAASGLYLLQIQSHLVRDPLFRAKMLLIVILFVNGIFLNIWVTPRFRALADTWAEDSAEKETFERIAGAAAAISLIGWATVLLFGVLITHG